MVGGSYDYPISEYKIERQANIGLVNANVSLLLTGF